MLSHAVNTPLLLSFDQDAAVKGSIVKTMINSLHPDDPTARLRAEAAPTDHHHGHGPTSRDLLMLRISKPRTSSKHLVGSLRLQVESFPFTLVLFALKYPAASSSPSCRFSVCLNLICPEVSCSISCAIFPPAFLNGRTNCPTL